ncbi:putative mitochondrial protein [Cucumis melo var. makuwa]|uniref:Mitochondrial protein n=1 Tax=Cucumis melo var. makuwa TaxID=1194695 RepID=A0A5D3BZM5_CUCMM|nr:putative mitochondrial protein [Cucumis melo var. makuwa]TYK04444.1 putative mitochondrial protein [Cucumis melo var. makuwa]
MVYFTKRFLSGVRHLVVSSDRNQPREDELNFLVEKPWTGSFANRWPCLDNNLILPRLSVEIPLSMEKTAWVIQSSIHNKAPNSDRALTLGQRLIEGQTRWGAMTKKGSFLHPGVFMAASLMTTDAIYSLAVPVLANIYHGLGLITKASNPIGRMDFHFLCIMSMAGGMPPAITPDNMLHHWRICTRRNTLFELYLPDRSLEPCKHVTHQFTDWWAMRLGTYLKDNIHHLVSSVIPPPSQPKLPKNRGSNLGGKEIRLVEAMAATLKEEINEHKDESDSSKSDCHWKRSLKKAKSPLNAHLEGLVELDNDESLAGPHVVDSTIERVGTSKTPVSKPAEQSLRPSALFEEIRRSKMTMGGKSIGSPPSKGDACPKEPLQKVSSAHASLKYSESPLDASNRQITRNPEPSQWVGEKVVSNFFKKIDLCMWEDIQDKIMRTPFEYIPRLRPEIAIVLSGIEKIHADGLTPLEEYLNSYLKRVDNFNDVQSSYSAQLLSIDKARQLDENTSAIEEALTLMEQLREDAKVIQERAT